MGLYLSKITVLKILMEKLKKDFKYVNLNPLHANVNNFYKK